MYILIDYTINLTYIRSSHQSQCGYFVSFQDNRSSRSFPLKAQYLLFEAVMKSCSPPSLISPEFNHLYPLTSYFDRN